MAIYEEEASLAILSTLDNMVGALSMANSQKILSDSQAIRLTILVSWIAYAAITVGRYVFSASLGTLIASKVYTESQLGMISATFMLLYGFGQFLSGLIADSFRPFRLIFLSLAVSATANLLIPFTKSFNAFFLVWSVNALFQSLAWPSMTRLFSDKLSIGDCTRACVNMSSASIFGMIMAYGCTSLAIHLISWEFAFYFSGGLLLASCTLWVWFTKRQKRFSTHEVTETPRIHSSYEQKKAVPSSPNHYFISVAMLLIVLGCFFHGSLKDGIFT